MIFWGLCTHRSFLLIYIVEQRLGKHKQKIKDICGICNTMWVTFHVHVFKNTHDSQNQTKINKKTRHVKATKRDQTSS